MSRKLNGCGEILRFRGLITPEEKQFLKYCCKVVSLTKGDIRRLARIRRKTEKIQNRAAHIMSIIEMIERVHFD